MKWNREYLGLPKIAKDEQHVLAVTAEQVEKLVSESSGDEQVLYVIAASTGMRIGEILGLEARHVVNNGRTLVVEQSVNRFGRLSGLKTRAAKRNVDVSKAIGEYLLSIVEGKSGLLFKTKKGTHFVPEIYAVVGWMKGSMTTAFTVSADSESRVWKRCERTDT